MFDHSVFITASYLATALVLAWCALSPVLKTRKIRTQLVRQLSRTGRENTE